MQYMYVTARWRRLIASKETVEEGTARGTTTLVYLQLHISLYTGTVHVLSRVAGVRAD